MEVRERRRETRGQGDRCERHYKRGMEKTGNRLDLRGKQESAGFSLSFWACVTGDNDNFDSGKCREGACRD